MGFSTMNMSDISGGAVLSRNDNGVVSGSFTFNPEGITGANGISIFKGDGIKGKFQNIQLVDTTMTEIGVSEKWTVNTSATDRSLTTQIIENNYVVNSNFTGLYKLYIHSKTVDGIRYALNKNNFNFTVKGGNFNNVSGSMVNLGSAGYYDNVVQISFQVEYDSGNLFPSADEELFVQVVEINDGVTIAIDQ